MTPRKLIVVKYGGSVLEDGLAFRRAAEAVKEVYEKGIGVVVVVSALKGVTDQLLGTAEVISPDTPPEVIDHIIGLGEEQSVRLMASALRSVGVDSVEVTPHSPGWPIVTDETYGDAEPIIEECRSGAELGLRPLMERGRVPVVCGFVGRSLSGKFTTLGRGGSDTTAVILARCLDADELVLVKDVGGIYSSDPKMVEGARRIEALTAMEAHLLSSDGAEVLHSKVFRYKPAGLKVRFVSIDQPLEGSGTVMSGTVPLLRVEANEKPVTRLNIVRGSPSIPPLLIQVSEKVEEAGGEILSLKGAGQSLTAWVVGPPGIIGAVHSLVEETEHVRAVSGTSGEALITLVGTILDSPGKAIPKILGLLASRGIVARDVNTGPSTAGILVDWERRLDALDSLENGEWSNWGS